MKTPLSRRTLLRGAGAALALPALQAMVPVRRTTLDAPRRLVFVYVPNGVHMPDWTPAQVGALELSPLLAPLARHRERLLVITGLAHDKARANGDGPGDHARSAATFLTAAQALKTDGPIRAGISADQVAARAVGDATRLRSIELGCEAGRLGGQCDNGYSCAYSNSIAWSTPHTPLGKEVDPRLVFDRLFRDGDQNLSEIQRTERDARRRSVLDLVRADARRLSARLGPEDRRKLDEYQSGVRELERRIQFAAQRATDGGYERPDQVPDGFAELARLQINLLALGFSTDTTRIATLMLANEGSGKSYPEIDAPEGHHELSHHGGDAEKLRKVAAINRLHVEQFAHLLDALNVDEQGAPLLERCAIAYGSCISDGDRHNHEHLPILFAGGGVDALRTGRHVRLERETPCANLWLTMLDSIGAPVASLGDSTGRLVV